MRRPIVLILICFIMGILYFHYWTNPIYLSISIVIGTVCFINIKGQEKYQEILNQNMQSSLLLLIILSFIAAGGSLLIQDYRCNEPIDLTGKETVLNGTVFSYEWEKSDYDRNKVSFVLKDDNGKKYQVKWYTKEECSENLTGRSVSVYGTFEKPTGRRNPGTFDYSLYLKSKGIRWSFNCKSLNVNKESFENFYFKFINTCVSFRDKFIYELEKNQDMRFSGVQKGIMFGIKDDLSDDIYEQFQKNGTAHLLATSGLHMGIIYGVLSKLIHPGIRIIPNTVIIIIMFCYVVMADYNPSIIRAFIMICIAILGRIFCRRYDLLAASCTASLFMLACNPYLLFSTGFQMSFLAVFIMAFTLNKLKYFNIKDGWFKKLLPVFIIQILMAPYIWYNFNYFSFSSFIANPPVTVLGTWILMLGSSLMIFPLFSLSIPAIFTKILTAITNLMLEVNTMTYLNGMLTARLKSPGLFTVVLFYGLVFLYLNEDTIIMYLRKKYKKIVALSMCVFIFASICGVGFRTGFENCNMIFVDIGQGNSMLFKSDDGKTLLIDGGGKMNYEVGTKTLMPALLKNGVKTIDYAYVTHWDTDHFKGIEEIAKAGMVQNIITYEGNIINKDKLIKEMGIKPENMHFLCRNDKFKVGSNINVRVLSPFEKSPSDYEKELKNEKENNRSLVSMVTVNDTKFLITGDIDENCERKMVKKIGRELKADILQVPHHGSKTSSSDELIEAVNPKVAVFQCGKNNYGHPAPEIIEKYKKKGIIVYRNDLSGAVGLEVGKNNNVRIRTVISIDKRKFEKNRYLSTG